MQTMTRDEAQRQVTRVRDGLKMANNALHQLHAGKGWKALGYPTFAAMCDGEFGMSAARAYQRLDHARTVHVMAELLGLDGDAVEAAVPEGLSREVRGHVHDVATAAAGRIADIPADASVNRRRIDTERAVRTAALHVRDNLRGSVPRRPEQSRRTGPLTGHTPYGRAIATGKAHVEAVQVLFDGREPLADVEKLQLMDLREQVTAVYEQLFGAWAGEPLTGRASPRPATDPFVPPPTGRTRP